MKKIVLLLVLFFSPNFIVGMQQNPKVIFSEKANEEMHNLKVTLPEIYDVLINGNKNKDKDNRGVILHSQRSALPHPEFSSRDYDQLVIAVAKEPVEGKIKVLSVFYKKDAFKPRQKKKN